MADKDNYNRRLGDWLEQAGANMLNARGHKLICNFAGRRPDGVFPPGQAKIHPLLNLSELPDQLWWSLNLSSYVFVEWKAISSPDYFRTKGTWQIGLRGSQMRRFAKISNYWDKKDQDKILPTHEKHDVDSFPIYYGIWIGNNVNNNTLYNVYFMNMKTLVGQHDHSSTTYDHTNKLGGDNYFYDVQFIEDNCELRFPVFPNDKMKMVPRIKNPDLDPIENNKYTFEFLV